MVALPTSAIAGSRVNCAAGSNATISISLTGQSPWDVTYTSTSGGTSTPTTVSGITSSPYTFVVNPTSTTSYAVTAIHDGNNLDATNSGMTGVATVTIPVISTRLLAGTK